MKKLSLLILVILLGSFHGYSQPGTGRGQQERMEAINAQRIAFITDRMALTPEEARVFWPMYNAYTEKRDALMHDHGQQADKKDVREMNSAEAARFAEAEISRLEESARLKREVHERLKQIISIEKIARLYEAEKEFNRMIFRQARQQQRGR